ncbi:MAG TPA: tetratricopeptide repeat protein [Ktedonobacteraceae bacterium]|nr:tetratricopeptide repeat protein [Ktedonobacteraceae bacterium]
MDEMLQQNSALASTRCEEGKHLLNLQQYEDALATFAQAARLDPNTALAHNGQSAALIRLRRYDDALLACEQAIWLDPTYVNGGKNILILSTPLSALEILTT